MSREEEMVDLTNSLSEPGHSQQPIDTDVQQSTRGTDPTTTVTFVDKDDDGLDPTTTTTTAVTFVDKDDNGFDIIGSLLSNERLDRDSPELWPENFPGVSDFLVRDLNTNETHAKDVPEWLSDFSNSEMDILQGFSSLTVAALLDKVRELEDLAFQLGIEESNEMTRGKFLDVLGAHHQQQQSTNHSQTNHNQTNHYQTSSGNANPSILNGESNLSSFLLE